MAGIVVSQGLSTSWINPELGIFTRKTRLSVSGLTAGAANTIPHGLTSSTGAPVAPQRVIPIAYNATAQVGVAVVALDGTHGNTITNGPGFDATNIYVIVPSGANNTQAAFEIDGY
jgi:hypothetical protein